MNSGRNQHQAYLLITHPWVGATSYRSKCDKLSQYMPWWHMGGIKVWIHTFLTLTLYECQVGYTHCEKGYWYPRNSGLVAPRTDPEALSVKKKNTKFSSVHAPKMLKNWPFVIACHKNVTYLYSLFKYIFAVDQFMWHLTGIDTGPPAFPPVHKWLAFFNK